MRPIKVKKLQLDRERRKHDHKMCRPKRTVRVLNKKPHRVRISTVIFDPADYVVVREIKGVEIDNERLADVEIDVECVLERVEDGAKVLVPRKVLKDADPIKLVEAILGCCRRRTSP